MHAGEARMLFPANATPVENGWKHGLQVIAASGIPKPCHGNLARHAFTNAQQKKDSQILATPALERQCP